MNLICEKLKNNIKKSAYGKFDPYETPFRPKDLKLSASDYGAFSDHCKKGTTQSSKWCGCGLLKKVSKGKIFKYILKK